MSASSTTLHIQLRGPRFAVDAEMALRAIDPEERFDFICDAARQVLTALTNEERSSVYAVAAYDLSATVEITMGESKQLQALCNVVSARILLRGRVSADVDQKVGTLSAGAAWMLLGMSPLCPSTRAVMMRPDACLERLLRDFDVAPKPTADGFISLQAAAAAVGRIVGTIVDAEPLFHPPTSAAH